MDGNILALVGLLVVIGMGMSFTTSNQRGGKTMRRHQRGGKSKKHRKH